MFRKSKKISSLFGLVITLLFLVTSNHCIFEEVLIALGIAHSDHLSNHPGATSEHKHENSPDSHQHGEPHPVMVFSSNRSGLDLDLTLVDLPIPFTFISIINSGLHFPNLGAKLLSSLTNPFSNIQYFIACLNSAPQAPPVLSAHI